MANKLCNVLTTVVLISVGFVLLLQNVQAQEKPVTDVCLGCICEAISGCNQTAICTGGVCGLFRITWAYWADGGKLTLNNEPAESETAYPNCVNDPYCAADTIQNYMRKFAQDCNDDNIVDCFDFAAIHKLGGYGCKGELSYPYVNSLSTCLSSFKGIDVRSN